MARTFQTPINLAQLASAPSSPVAGETYYNTTNGAAYVYNGTSWQPCDASKSTIIPTGAIAGFASGVLAAVLSGLSTATNAVVTATDTVLSALGKLQAQVSACTLNAAAAITGGTIAGVTVSNAVINTAALDTSLDLNFLSGVLDSRITFTRASIATYFDATGTMQTAASGVARFDHSPTLVDSASAPYVYTPLGLLIEEGRTNLALQSASLTTTPWGTANTTAAAPVVTANSAAAPDGTTTATMVAFPAVSSGKSELYQAFTATAAVYTVSLFLKGSVGGEQVYLFFVGPGAVYYRLRVTLTTAWQRFTVTSGANLTAATWDIILGCDLTDAGQSSISAQTIYAWGAQVELGTFATSYIPTTSAAVTRAADVATMPVGSWFTQGLGSLGVEAVIPTTQSGYPYLVTLSDGTNSNYIDLIYSAVYSRYQGDIINAGTTSFTSFSLSTATLSPGAIAKAALSWGSGTASFEVNPGSGPVAVATASGTASTTITTLNLGLAPNVVPGGSRYLRRVRYWPRALSTTELQTVTASATPALLNLAIDQCPIGATNPSSGAFTTITLSQAEIDASAYTTAPVTSGTVTIPGTAARCVINPAGTLAALTVVSPAALSLGANSVQSLDILFTQAITSLTWTAGSGTTFGGAAMPSTVALGTCVRLLWVQSLSKWLHTTVV